MTIYIIYTIFIKNIVYGYIYNKVQKLQYTINYIFYLVLDKNLTSK